jgi:hypothetical protein
VEFVAGVVKACVNRAVTPVTLAYRTVVRFGREFLGKVWGSVGSAEDKLRELARRNPNKRNFCAVVAEEHQVKLRTKALAADHTLNESRNRDLYCKAAALGRAGWQEMIQSGDTESTITGRNERADQDWMKIKSQKAALNEEHQRSEKKNRAQMFYLKSLRTDPQLPTFDAAKSTLQRCSVTISHTLGHFWT